MGSLPRACYFAGTNDCVTHVHETSPSHIWSSRFSYVVEVTKQMGHVAILIAITKGPFGLL
jgi:hypothetical protein